MRMVQVTITYDIDDPDKSLDDELLDWLRGEITVQDVQGAGCGYVTIKEMDNA